MRLAFAALLAAACSGNPFDAPGPDASSSGGAGGLAGSAGSSAGASGTAGVDAGADAWTVCEPGTTSSCACDGAPEGFRVCLGDGSGWAKCKCFGEDAGASGAGGSAGSGGGAGVGGGSGVGGSSGVGGGAGTAGAGGCPEACSAYVDFPMVQAATTKNTSGHYTVQAACPGGSTLKPTPVAPYCQECSSPYASHNVTQDTWHCTASQGASSGTCKIHFRCEANDWCTPLGKPCP